MIHNLPLQGVEAYPNNITIMRFLDLDLTHVQKSEALRNISPDVCAQCNQKLENLAKCLDCERFFNVVVGMYILTQGDISPKIF